MEAQNRYTHPPEQNLETLDFVDIGCSGTLASKWYNLYPLLSYTGFDPNREECDRLRGRSHPYRRARYLPYAIAGQAGNQTLYRTQNSYCYSLLRPNHPWLQRFSFAELFREVGTETVECATLNQLYERENLRANILKLDTQGLELPILKAGDRLLETVFCIETETGFVENYVGETTYNQVERFLSSRGYLLFDLKTFEIGRNNSFANSGKHQPLWCEALWMFDFYGRQVQPSPLLARQSLAIAIGLRYFDYAFELADYFYHSGIIDANLVSATQQLDARQPASPPPKSKAGKLFSIMPRGLLKKLQIGLEEVLDN